MGIFNTKTFYTHINNNPKLNALSVSVDSAKSKNFIVKGSLDNAFIADTTFTALVKNKNCLITIWNTGDTATLYHAKIKAADWKGKSVKIYKSGKLSMGDIVFGLLVILAGT